MCGCGRVLRLWPQRADVEPNFCDEKSVSRPVGGEVPLNHQALETVMAITHCQTAVSWHFRSFKDDVLNIELQV